MAFGDNQIDMLGVVTGATAAGASSGVTRDTENVPQDRSDLVARICDDVRAARAFWDKDFKRMRKDQDFLLGLQYDGQESLEDGRYIANIVQRHVSQRTAAVYAKNPTVVARRKETIDFLIWDENPLTYQMASQFVAQAGQTVAAAQAGDPQAGAMVQQAALSPQMQQQLDVATALLADVQQGSEKRQMAMRISRTMELYFKNKVLSQQNPPFKASMKQLVRRALAAGVGYLKLGLVREMDVSPDALKGMATAKEQMAHLDALMASFVDGDARLSEASSKREELRLMIEEMQKQPQVVTQEGLSFDFPSATSIIPDQGLVHLQGFIGCEWVAEEYMFTPDQIEAIWKVDVSKDCTRYYPGGHVQKAGPVVTSSGDPGHDKKTGTACVFQVYNRKTGLVYTVCDGYKDFLTEPHAPKVKLERFFPWYALAFNYIEHHKQRFPLSDAFLLRHQQREMNRSREGLRQHRIANRPCTFVAAGVLDEKTQEDFQNRPSNAVIQTNAMTPGQKISDVLQAYQHPPIDPRVYDTDHVFQDVLRVVGSQEANLGGTAGATATESSIAESSRMSSLQSNMDDMDDFLTEVMRDAGQIALLEIGADEVKRIVGAGAVWPTLSRQDVADEIFLEIQAGSSGRPNKALEVQNITQAMPFLIQLPGLNPQWLARQLLTRLDDRLDLTDAFIAGNPSIQSLNAMAAKPLGMGPEGAGKPGGPGAEDPNAQGAEGGQNLPGGTGAGGAAGAQPANAAPPAAPPVTA